MLTILGFDALERRVSHDLGYTKRHGDDRFRLDAVRRPDRHHGNRALLEHGPNIIYPSQDINPGKTAKSWRGTPTGNHERGLGAAGTNSRQDISGEPQHALGIRRVVHRPHEGHARSPGVFLPRSVTTKIDTHPYHT